MLIGGVWLKSHICLGWLNYLREQFPAQHTMQGTGMFKMAHTLLR